MKDNFLNDFMCGGSTTSLGIYKGEWLYSEEQFYISLREVCNYLDFLSLYDEQVRYDNIIIQKDALSVIGDIALLKKVFVCLKKMLNERGRLLIEGSSHKVNDAGFHVKKNDLTMCNEMESNNDTIFVDLYVLIETAMLMEMKIVYVLSDEDNYSIVLENDDVINRFWKRERLFRSAENEWDISEGNCVVNNMQDVSFGIADTNAYRVDQVGPYRLSLVSDDKLEYRIKYESLTKLMKEMQTESGRKIYLAGSQSPLSCKLPNSASDVDIYIVMKLGDDINTLKRLATEFESKYSENFQMSVGVIFRSWLETPFFAEAVDIDEYKELASKSYDECMQEYARRLEKADKYMVSLSSEKILDEIEKMYQVNLERSKIAKIVATPRWRSVYDGFGRRLQRIGKKN